jgi:PilZ domain
MTGGQQTRQPDHNHDLVRNRATRAYLISSRNLAPRRHTQNTAKIVMHTPGKFAANSEIQLGSAEQEAYGIDFLGLLIAMQPEVERVCILTGLSSCVANAIADNAPNVRSRALITFFPRESSRLLLATSRFRRFYSPCPPCDSIDMFYSALASAKQVTLDFAAETFGTSAENPFEFAEQAESWRMACLSGLTLMAAIQEALTNYDISGATVATEPLISLLESAIRGEHGPVDRSGTTIMPSWAERRNADRVRVFCPARLLHNGEEQRVILRDISVAGLGLDAVQDVMPGDKVAVHIGQSLSADGTVVWANDNRAGIMLGRPIHSDDPRVKFCSSRHLVLE